VLCLGLSLSSVLRWLSPTSGDSSRGLVVGTPGAGKSLLVRALAQLTNRRGEAVVVVDPTYRGGIPGWYHAESLPQVVDLVERGHVPVVRERWPAVVDLVWKAGNCLLVVDEVADCGGGRNQVYPTLWHIARKGRHRNVSLLMATQRRVEVDARVQNLAQGIFVGMAQGEADRRWAENTWSISPPEEPMVFAVSLPGKAGEGEIRLKIRKS